MCLFTREVSHTYESLDDVRRVFPTFEVSNEFPTLMSLKVGRGSIVDKSGHLTFSNALIYSGWNIHVYEDQSGLTFRGCDLDFLSNDIMASSCVMLVYKLFISTLTR